MKRKSSVWRSTCGGIRSIRIASPLDEFSCEAVLVKRGAVHDDGVVLERVYRWIRGQGDVLQSQPQSRAALVVLQLHVKTGETVRLGCKDQLWLSFIFILKNWTYCLHCSSCWNTVSFPDTTASCSGVLQMPKHWTEAVLCRAALQPDNPGVMRPTDPCCSACWG